MTRLFQFKKHKDDTWIDYHTGNAVTPTMYLATLDIKTVSDETKPKHVAKFLDNHATHGWLIAFFFAGNVRVGKQGHFWVCVENNCLAKAAVEWMRKRRCIPQDLEDERTQQMCNFMWADPSKKSPRSRISGKTFWYSKIKTFRGKWNVTNCWTTTVQSSLSGVKTGHGPRQLWRGSEDGKPRQWQVCSNLKKKNTKMIHELTTIRKRAIWSERYGQKWDCPSCMKELQKIRDASWDVSHLVKCCVEPRNNKTKKTCWWRF